MTLAAILLVCVVTLAAAQSSSQLTCPGKTTCRECIQTSNCRWCTQANFTKPRCHGHDIGYCPEEYTVDPSNEAITLIARELSKPTKVGGGGAGGGYEAEMSGSSHWSSSSSSHSSSSSSSSSSGHMSASGHNIVQIYPQRVQLKLRLSKFFVCNPIHWKGKATMDIYLPSCASKAMPEILQRTIIPLNLTSDLPFQTKSTDWASSTRKPKTTPWICTTSWTCPNPWRTTRKSFPPLVPSWPRRCRRSRPTSGSGSARLSTRSWCRTFQPYRRSKYRRPPLPLCSDLILLSASVVNHTRSERVPGLILVLIKFL